MGAPAKKKKKAASKTTVVKLKDLKGKKNPKGGTTVSGAGLMGGGWMSSLRQ